MKAKEYAAQYRELVSEGSDKYPANTIVKRMIREVGVLQGVRSAQSNSSMLSILQEQERKWQSFCRIVGEESLRLDGFREVIKGCFPSYVMQLWESYERSMQQRQTQRRTGR